MGNARWQGVLPGCRPGSYKPSGSRGFLKVSRIIRKPLLLHFKLFPFVDVTIYSHAINFWDRCAYGGVLDSRKSLSFALSILMNKVRNKETNINNAWQKYKIRTGFEPGSLDEKPIPYPLNRIFSKGVVRYCI